jgi:predicted nuclease of predicted toxin-antitoxin system
VNFLIDDQLPVALARWIAQQGFTANHLKDVGLTGQDDDVIWAFAERAGAILVSKDNDFLDRHLRSYGSVALIFLAWGNVRKGTLLKQFETEWPALVAKLQAGEKLIKLE